ncbi:hypothetical protein AWB70_05701 [Caballeronia cordobensis]|uniref:Fimbrial protein n=1 Tax=Caballeronia cordobensis TaxID=1353886 RepID=A0A158J0S3_CABCO|nr:hypothetical protein AWB70_05701 [Caballeronia cordobensis]
MMKRNGAHVTLLIALTGASVLYPMTGAATTRVPGGVITFRGALVAPPFDVSIGTTPTLGVSTAEQTRSGESSGNTLYVTYGADPRNPPNADVSLSVAGHATNGGQALAASFSDGKGRKMTPGIGGEYHLGALGGTLAIRAKDDASSSATRVTIVTNYR